MTNDKTLPGKNYLLMSKEEVMKYYTHKSDHRNHCESTEHY